MQFFNRIGYFKREILALPLLLIAHGFYINDISWWQLERNLEENIEINNTRLLNTHIHNKNKIFVYFNTI